MQLVWSQVINMSDHLERVLLTNVPDFLDGWVLKSTIPCGGLIHRIEISPSNSSKMMIFTKGQDSAQRIASMLDHYNFCGSVIRARYIFVKPPEASKVKVTSSSTGDVNSKQPGNVERHEIQADVEDKYDADDDKKLVGHSGNNMQRPQKLLSTDSVPQKVSRCRFCHRSGHVTWLCQQNAEYYKVSRTTKGMNPPGYQWPESSVVKVEGLSAGPIIEYIEKFHLQMEKMNAQEIRIMFAWLTNYVICHNCGAAGHRETDEMCKYLPLGCPVTDDMITRLRRPFCRRMNCIRDQVSFGKLQQYAHIYNLQFRDSTGIKDGRPLKYPLKRKEEDKEENVARKVSRVPPQRSGLVDPPAGTSKSTGGMNASASERTNVLHIV